MAGPFVKDRVKETSTTTGTGTYTLAGAVTGFQAFTSVLVNSDTCFYCAEDGTNWEIGIGTFTTSGTTLARTTVLFSSNANAAVNWAAGTRNVFITNVSEYTSPLIKPSSTTHAIKVANETVLSSTLGNARGTGAVDLQTKRVSAAKVASGAYSVISGGYSNQASGSRSSVSGGQGSLATNTYAAVVNGYANTASGVAAIVGGGKYNASSQSQTTIGGGRYNAASVAYATIPGGFRAKADKYAQQAYASGRFSADGDAQTSCFIARCKPTDSTATELFLDGSGASKRMTLANDTSWGFEIQCIARRTDTDGTNAYWNLSGAIKRDTNAASTALVGAVVSLANQADAGAALWTLTASADTTNGSLKLTFTGTAASTVQVVAVVNTTETTG